MNEKLLHDLDIGRLEDAQFDMLIGKEPADERLSALNSKSHNITENQIVDKDQMMMTPSIRTWWTSGAVIAIAKE